MPLPLACPHSVSCRLLVASALLVSAALLLLLSTVQRPPDPVSLLSHVMMSSSMPERSVQPPARCLEGVVTTVPGGRLGNLAMEYATAWALARRHGLRLAVAHETFAELSAVFAGLTGEPLSQLLQELPCSGLNLTEEQVLDNERYHLPPPFRPEEQIEWARSRHFPVVLRKHTMSPELIASSLDELRQEFVFRPEIQRRADEKLIKAKLQTATKAACSENQVCTVGVHVRRTDYGEYMRETYGLRQEAGPAYYRAATGLLLRRLWPRCAAVAFVATSDDPGWCRRRLLPALARNDTKRSPVSAVFLMSSENPVDDLCLLASCQHAVISYGTFGALAAALTGGTAILYDTTQHGQRRRQPPLRMADYLPQWDSLP